MEALRTKRIYKILLVVIIGYFFILGSITSEAIGVVDDSTRDALRQTNPEGADKFIEVYKNNADILENNFIITDGIRAVGFYFVKGLVYLSENSEDMYDTAFGFIDITNSDLVIDFIEEFKPLLIALIALSLFYLSLKFIFNLFKNTRIDVNIVIFMLVVTGSTFAFGFLNSVVIDLKEAVQGVYIGASKTESTTYTVIDNNMVDLVALADSKNGRYKSLANLDYNNRFERKNGKKDYEYENPGITEDNFKYIDYNAVLNYEDDVFNWDDDSRTILKYRLVPTVDGFATVENYNGVGYNSDGDDDLLNEFYYRYHINFSNTVLQLLALSLIYLAMSYKVVRIAYELIIARLFAYLYSTDIAGGERIRRILTTIRDSYIVLVVTTVSLKVYEIFSQYINNSVESSFAQGFFCLFAAFVVIDGPNVAQKILGIDAGLGSSTARFLAMYGGLKGSTILAGRGLSKFGTSITGKKTSLPVPNDGKRHGGLRDKFNGTTTEGKKIAKKQWDDAVANSKGVNLGKDKNIDSEPVSKASDSKSTSKNESFSKEIQSNPNQADKGNNKDLMNNSTGSSNTGNKTSDSFNMKINRKGKGDK